ncbi:NADH-quinone oxidoreductase subunit N [Streptosporangium saharense]|uniref:NADH-quinone oxidoreductase subunit N n=1 Tax=Streptosporangium saharense TaxID=1706840 RepID=UPI0034476465
MVQSIDYFAVAPPLVLALAAGLVLLLDAFLPRRPYVRPVLGAVTLTGVLVALGFVIAQASRSGEAIRTFCVPESLTAPTRGIPAVSPAAPPGVEQVTRTLTGTAAAAPGPGTVSAPSCSFVVDDFTLIFAGLVLAAGVVVVLLSMTLLASGEIPVGEWHFLLLCTLTGAVALPASRDLIMLVVALELVSLPVFALTGLRRHDGRASEAAVKLFLVSVVSTAVTLFGISLLYGATGTVHLDRLAQVLRERAAVPAAPGPGQAAGTALPQATGAADVAEGYVSSLHIVYDAPPPDLSSVLTVAVVLVLAGFAFKVAAVPFHAWAGDVYQGAPVPVAALLSVISKAAGFAGLILILVTALGSESGTWVPLVAIIAALTMTVGNLLALRQRHAVRLLAWSSVAQSGYILAPLGVRDDEATSASIAYLVFYAAMNLGAFAVVMLVSRRAARNELDDYRGLAFRNPAAGLALVFFLLCLAGLPPGLVGLFAKIVVFRELVVGNVGWLAVVMAVNTVIGLYYYVAWAVRILTPVPGRAAGKAAPGPDHGEVPGDDAPRAVPAVSSEQGITGHAVPGASSGQEDPGRVLPSGRDAERAVPGAFPDYEDTGRAAPEAFSDQGDLSGREDVSGPQVSPGRSVSAIPGQGPDTPHITPPPPPAAPVEDTDGGGSRTGWRAGWVPVAVAIGLTAVVALLFSVAPQMVLDLLPGVVGIGR